MMRLQIDGWEQGLKFAASHFIPGHEKCARLHGHTYAISASVEGTQDDMGIVLDFIEMKSAMRKICEELDHHVILPKESPHVELTLRKNSVVARVGKKKYEFPLDDVVFIDVVAPSAEELSRYALKRIVQEIKFPEGVSAVEVRVEEGRGQGAWARETL